MSMIKCKEVIKLRIDRKKFKILLVNMDLTQKELAKRAGVSRATVNSVANGKSCTEEVGKKIVTALGVDVTEIIE
jgi:DNA-binding XRE family transcriptional regulator